ncbi:hypothetical protein WN943_010842 [Citrus x changshan-huyou]
MSSSDGVDSYFSVPTLWKDATMIKPTSRSPEIFKDTVGQSQDSDHNLSLETDDAFIETLSFSGE